MTANETAFRNQIVNAITTAPDYNSIMSSIQSLYDEGPGENKRIATAAQALSNRHGDNVNAIILLSGDAFENRLIIWSEGGDFSRRRIRLVIGFHDNGSPSYSTISTSTGTGKYWIQYDVESDFALGVARQALLSIEYSVSMEQGIIPSKRQFGHLEPTAKDPRPIKTCIQGAAMTPALMNASELMGSYVNCDVSSQALREEYPQRGSFETPGGAVQVQILDDIPEEALKIDQGRSCWAKVVQIDDDGFPIISIKEALSLSAEEKDENGLIIFNPALYGMIPDYDSEGNYKYPEGFDPDIEEWLPGAEEQRERWESEYAMAEDRYKEHRQWANMIEATVNH